MVDKEKGALPEERCTTTQHDCTSSKGKKQHKSQKSKILDYMLDNGSITQKEAVEHFGCYRLSARIKDLRDEEYNIITVSEQNEGYGNHARYFLKQKGHTDELYERLSMAQR